MSTLPPDSLALRVLVAEDNAINQVVAQSMLATLGVVCVLASDGEEAVSRAAEQDFDLILMDLHMPRLGGADATRLLHAQAEVCGRPRVPVVAMTAGDELLDGPDCRAAGMDGFLSKPYTLQALEDCLGLHIGPRSLRPAAG